MFIFNFVKTKTMFNSYILYISYPIISYIKPIFITSSRTKLYKS